MKEAGIAGLIERFADLPDPRVEGRTDHDLLDIVVLALCAVMSGAEGWDDIEDWGRERAAWLRRYLRLRNGIPGHDTIRRVFEAISPLALEERFEDWMSATCPAVKGRVIAIDGKALRGSGRSERGLRALHQVSAYAAEYGLTLGQRTCEAKSNEISAIKELLPSLALEGAIVTIDAMGCQTAIAEQITTGGGDYVLAVKDNQPQLAAAPARLLLDLERAGALPATGFAARDPGQGPRPNRDTSLHRRRRTGLARTAGPEGPLVEPCLGRLHRIEARDRRSGRNRETLRDLFAPRRQPPHPACRAHPLGYRERPALVP